MNNTVIEQQVSNVEQQLSEIDKMKQDFIKLIDTMESCYVTIGMRLNELKIKIKEDAKLEDDKLATTKLMDWLKVETRLSYSSANRYMRIAKCYDSQVAKDMAVTLGVKKAYLLLKIDKQEERLKFVNDNNIKSKSYDETNKLLLDYLSRNKPDAKKRVINSKSAIKKLRTTIDKEVDKYNLIIDEMGTDAPGKIHDIKDKLCELQQLLMEDDDTDAEDGKMLKTELNDHTDEEGKTYLNFD